MVLKSENNFKNNINLNDRFIIQYTAVYLQNKQQSRTSDCKLLKCERHVESSRTLTLPCRRIKQLISYG
jgi:hypothetical protein